MTQPDPLFRVLRQNDVTVVEFLRNDLDPEAVDTLASELQAIASRPDAHKLVLDLAKVRFVPSRVLGVLVELNRVMGEQQHQLRICGLQPMILSVFKFTRLDTVLKLTPTREEAVASFGG